MVAILSLLAVIVMSIIIVRVATVALTLTGLSEQLARFQARSAFTGTGFTTVESEKVVQHPVRRRIIMLLMLLGNAGIVTAMSSLILSFTDTSSTVGNGIKIISLIAGLSALWMIATSHWLDRRMTKIISWALKRFTDLELRDYAGLLHLTGDYIVAELNVTQDDWLCNQTLQSLRLNDEGVLVLGIEKSDGIYVGAPRGHHQLQEGDTILIYGRQPVLSNLDERRSGARGNWDHHKAVDQQRRVDLAVAEVEAQMETNRETSDSPSQATSN